MSALLLFLTSTLAAGTGTPPVEPLDPTAHEAIVRAVRARVGAAADVTVVPLEAANVPTMAIADAVLEPGATIGRPVRVVLRAVTDRTGSATLTPVARVTVRLEMSVDHWHTVGVVRRGQRLDAADLRPARHPFAAGPLAGLPDEDDVVGAAVLRDLPADACLTGRTLLPQPAVRAGETVGATVRIGTVEARAEVVAIDAGRVGAIVRVRHPDTRRTLSATVVGRGEVEVQR